MNENVFIDNRDLKTFPFKFGKIRGEFYCAYNKLKTLKGAPNEITLFFNCNGNNLTTLIDGPKKVGGAYYCSDNLLKDVYGFPEHFNNNVHISENIVWEIINLVDIEFRVKFIFWLNEYDVIRDGEKIVGQRLEEAYWMATKKELIYENLAPFKYYSLI